MEANCNHKNYICMKDHKKEGTKKLNDFVNKHPQN